LLTVASSARAGEPRVVSVSFQVDLDKRPTHLCVLTLSEATSKSIALKSLQGLRPEGTRDSGVWRLDDKTIPRSKIDQWLKDRLTDAAAEVVKKRSQTAPGGYERALKSAEKDKQAQL